MAFDRSARIGSTVFASAATTGTLPATARMGRFASDDGVVDAARPPHAWPIGQQPQQNTGDVNMLNKIAPITRNTRPFTIDGSTYDGHTTGNGFTIPDTDGGG